MVHTVCQGPRTQELATEKPHKKEMRKAQNVCYAATTVQGTHYHGRGFEQVLRWQWRRQWKFKCPHSQIQSPLGQSDQGHHCRHLKTRFPHTGQVQSPGLGFHCQVSSYFRCVPQSHHCVKRLFMDLQCEHTQEPRSTHSLMSISHGSRLDELEASDPGPSTSDVAELDDMG